MSRHRNIRTRTFSEGLFENDVLFILLVIFFLFFFVYITEYDDYDYDQYGRSVEEDLCISPGTANMYLYENNMNTFPESLDQPSETDDLTSMHKRTYFCHCFFFIILIMYKNKGTKLNSCIQFIRDAIGDSKSEEEILFALRQTKCDPESAIDFLLSNQREKKEKQQKSEIIVTGNIFSNHV